MNVKEYELLMAMEGISDGYIASAGGRLTAKKAPPRRRPVRRTLAALAAALALAVSTFTAAMAASPEFRKAVLTFFRVGEREKVPEPGRTEGGAPEESGALIGGAVKVRYVRLDEGYYVRSGDLLYRLEFDEAVQDNRPVEFWTLDVDGVRPVEIRPDRRWVSVRWRGETYEAVFDWFEWEGEIRVDFTSIEGCSEAEGVDLNMDVNAIPGRTDQVLLTLRYDAQMSQSVWYMLYDLTTGETRDFMADTQAESFTREDRLHDAVWNDEMTGAVLVSGRHGEDTGWYLDVRSGELTKLSELTGVDANGFFFADERTLLLYKWDEPLESPGPDSVTCWACDLDTGKTRKTLDRTPELSELDNPPYGVIISYGNGKPWCVLVEKDGATRLRNLVDGEEIAIEDFVFAPGGDVLASPDGAKYLYFVRDLDAKPWIQWSELGVIDMERGTFIALGRDVPAAAEEGIFWLNDTCVGVESSGTGEDTIYGPGGYTLYEFGPSE